MPEKQSEMPPAIPNTPPVDPKTKAPLTNEPDSSGIGSEDTPGSATPEDQYQAPDVIERSPEFSRKDPAHDPARDPAMDKPEMGG